ERKVREIQDVEREQTRLTNNAAELGTELLRLQEEYAGSLRAFQESRRQLAAEERRVREPSLELERKLTERRKAEPNFERRIPDLDRELREVTKLLGQLLSSENLNAK